MSTPATSPERQPLASCPTCSSQLCAHLVCRMCNSCPECDRAPLPDVRAIHKAQRIERLRQRGIPEAQLEECCRALDELHADVCPCGNRKKPDWSFCSSCYRELPGELRTRLNLHITAGYLEAWHEATALLQKRFHRND